MNPILSAFTVRCSHVYCLSTDTDKQETTALGNSVYRKRRRKDFRSLFCAVCTWAYWQETTREAGQQHLQPNSEEIWNSSLVTKSVVIVFSLQATYASLACVSIEFWQYQWTYLRWVEWNWTDDSSRAGEACHVTNPSRRQGAKDWAVGLRRSGNRSRVSVGDSTFLFPGAAYRIYWMKHNELMWTGDVSYLHVVQKFSTLTQNCPNVRRKSVWFLISFPCDFVAWKKQRLSKCCILFCFVSFHDDPVTDCLIK